MELTNKEIKEYLHDPTVCPVCGGNDLDNYDNTMELGTPIAFINCENCGAEWINEYKLTGIRDLKTTEEQS